MKKLILLAVLLSSTIIGVYAYNKKNKEPLVSVVMPTYNRHGILPKSIESILNQTYKNFEFIIVDDGSTDGSIDLLKAYAEADPRIKIIQNETNKGIAYSRNRGTDAAKGKYIAIMDSDDYSLPKRLERHVKYLEQHPDVVALNALYIEENKKENGTNNWVPPNRFEIIFHLRNYFSNLSVFRKDYVKEHNIRYNENYISSEDYDFWAQIFMSGGKLRMLNEHLINVRRHRTNPKHYYVAIKKNAYDVKMKLLRHFGIQNPEELNSDCDILNAMAKINPQTNRVDQYSLELTIDRRCNKKFGPKKSFYIKHNDFIDYFVQTETKRIFKRQRNNDIYTLISETDNEIFVFKTPSGKIETYKRQKDGSLGYYPLADEE